MYKFKLEELTIPGLRVLVKYERPIEQLASGLVLPECVRDESQISEGTGVVMIKGTGVDISWKNHTKPRRLSKVWSKVNTGDRVLFRYFLKDVNNFSSFIGQVIEEEGEYFVLDIEDVVAILGDEKVGLTKVSGTKCYTDGQQK